MRIQFTKMHGLGNDFIVLDGVNQTLDLTPKRIATWAKRNTGIGFDQCLVIEPSDKPNIDFFYRIFNADGNEVGQCGNGARCLALFAKHQGLTTKNNLTVATKTTSMQLQINADDSVTVDMGTPRLHPTDIPFLAELEQPEYLLEFTDGSAIPIHAVSVGNPHAVVVVTDLMSAPVSTLGLTISHHTRFPEQVNAGFMEIVDPSHIKLRVYERGCGETLACGSGAVAAAIVGRLFHNLTASIQVSLLGGNLTVDWANTDDSVKLTGPATFVYEGTLF